MKKTAEQIQAELRDYFPAESIGWKPQTISGNRALAVAFIDARDVMDRLDAVVGVGNWKDSYTPLEGGNVACTLSLRIGNAWVSKTDVGGESDQKDASDRAKAAFSDSLKRAAVKWGIGRYIYALPLLWVDYDPQKKCFLREPQLAAKFLPRPKAAQPQAEAPPPAPEKSAPAAPPPEPAAQAPAAAPAARAKKAKGPPRNGEEFYQAVIDAEKLWIKQGHKVAGQVLRDLNAWAEGQKPPYPQLPQNWNAEQIAAGVEWLRGEQGKISARKQQGAA